jgi:hypothetical protein
MDALFVRSENRLAIKRLGVSSVKRVLVAQFVELKKVGCLSNEQVCSPRYYLLL